MWGGWGVCGERESVCVYVCCVCVCFKCVACGCALSVLCCVCVCECECVRGYVCGEGSVRVCVYVYVWA